MQSSEIVGYRHQMGELLGVREQDATCSDGYDAIMENKLSRAIQRVLLQKLPFLREISGEEGGRTDQLAPNQVNSGENEAAQSFIVSGPLGPIVGFGKEIENFIGGADDEGTPEVLQPIEPSPYPPAYDRRDVIADLESGFDEMETEECSSEEMRDTPLDLGNEFYEAEDKMEEDEDDASEDEYNQQTPEVADAACRYNHEADQEEYDNAEWLWEH